MNKRTENKILKLLEKIAEQNQQIIDHLNYKDYNWKPYKYPNPPFGTPWDSIPDYNTPKIVPNFPYDDKSTSWQPSNVKCPSCKRDTGIPFVLYDHSAFCY